MSIDCALKIFLCWQPHKLQEHTVYETGNNFFILAIKERDYRYFVNKTSRIEANVNIEKINRT